MYYSTDTPEVVKDVCRNSPDFIIFIRINLDVIRPALFPACLMGNIQALGKARCRPGSQFDAADFGSLTLAIKENRCEASKMAYFFVKFFIFFLSNV